MATTAKDKRDVYSLLSDKILGKLHEGIVPWRVSWTKAGIPENLISGFAYRGVNRILLAALGYERNLFLTSKQLKEIGGTLVPDERPHIVGYMSSEKNGKAEGEEEAPEETERKPMKLKYYTVFNIAQCSVPPDVQIPQVAIDDTPMRKFVEHKSVSQKGAYYDPLKDYVNMPKDFPGKEARCEAEFHQLMHATGHYSRLNRTGLIQMSEFGYDAFSHEELVAEIGTAYLMSHYGLTSALTVSPEYLAGWIRALESNRFLIYAAARDAEKAIDFLFSGGEKSGGN